MTEPVEAAAAPTPAAEAEKRRGRIATWVNSPATLGTVTLIAAVLGGFAEAGFGVIGNVIFPEKDHSQAYLQAADKFVAQMAADRNDVLEILKRMDERDADSRPASSLTQIELRVNNMFVNGSSLKEVTEAAAAAAAGHEARPLPRVRVARPAPAEPPPRPVSDLEVFITNGVGGGRPILKSRLTGAETADLWLGPGETRLIGPDLSASLGVGAPGSEDLGGTGRIPVMLNGVSASISPGEVLKYPSPTGECYVIFLRTEDPNPARQRDERHGFALRCASAESDP
jgi:hypothetical protein